MSQYTDLVRKILLDLICADLAWKSIKSPDLAPKGRKVRQGPRGGWQYETIPRKKKESSDTDKPEKVPTVAKTATVPGAAKHLGKGHFAVLTLTDREMETLKAYDTESQSINNGLIKRDLDTKGDLGKLYMKRIKTLDKILGRATLKSDITTYHGANHEMSSIMRLTGEGETITIPTFLTTTTKKSEAVSFAKQYGGDTIFAIKNKSGDNGFFFGNDTETYAYPGQLLLPRGKKYKVVSKTILPAKRTLVTLEEVDPNAPEVKVPEVKKPEEKKPAPKTYKGQLEFSPAKFDRDRDWRESDTTERSECAVPDSVFGPGKFIIKADRTHGNKNVYLYFRPDVYPYEAAIIDQKDLKIGFWNGSYSSWGTDIDHLIGGFTKLATELSKSKIKDIEYPSDYTGPKIDPESVTKTKLQLLNMITTTLLEDDFKHVPDMQEFFNLVDQATEKMFKNSRVCMRVKSNSIFKRLESGRILNQHESGSSNGMFNPEVRKKMEDKLFCLGKERHPKSTYPKYGYIATIDEKGDDHLHRESSNYLEQYGAVSLIFKDEVKHRSTMVGGDSLRLRDIDHTNEPIGVTTPVVSPSILSISPQSIPRIANVDSPPSFTRSNDEPIGDLSEIMKNIDVGKSANRVKANQFREYMEAQIHGELKLEDIERIVVYYDPSIRQSECTRSRNVLNKKDAQDLMAKISKYPACKDIVISLVEIQREEVD